MVDRWLANGPGSNPARLSCRGSKKHFFPLAQCLFILESETTYGLHAVPAKA